MWGIITFCLDTWKFPIIWSFGFLHVWCIVFVLLLVTGNDSFLLLENGFWNLKLICSAYFGLAHVWEQLTFFFDKYVWEQLTFWWMPITMWFSVYLIILIMQSCSIMFYFSHILWAEVYKLLEPNRHILIWAHLI